ncbi:hypothetical protein [Tannerella forsythia]|nr:hypothetical protein [Tannerella forsythia]
MSLGISADNHKKYFVGEVILFSSPTKKSVLVQQLSKEKAREGD